MDHRASPVQSPVEKKKYYRQVTTKLYVAHAITTWGDRMWYFAVSVFLVKLSKDFLLLLPAIYGLVSCCSVIVFGGVIGKWVDTTARMSVAWKSLVIQNSLVVVCSLALGGMLFNFEKLQQPHLRWILILLQATVIVLGAAANLASTASNISISKDWVVVIAKKDKNKLASINAACRSIDLTTKICSPLLVGLLMAELSDLVATIFIAAWNVFSMLAEFFLLLSIYNQATRFFRPRCQQMDLKRIFHAEFGSVTRFVPSRKDFAQFAKEIAIFHDLESETHFFLSRLGVSEIAFLYSEEMNVEPEEKDILQGNAPLAEEENSVIENFTDEVKKNEQRDDGDLSKNRNTVVRKISGYFKLWALYFRHPIFPAGFGLACLYMTVLAFDGITMGYAYSQGVSEIILGSLGGAGAVVGIVGTMIYPKLRRRIGIERTGLFGFFLEIACLSLCVASVWAPGSPFEPSSIFSTTKSTNQTQISNSQNNATLTNETAVHQQRDYTSIIFLMTGIVSSRAGLWISDMTVNQIIQEEVNEFERGRINGIQNSLNTVMELIKFVIVILFPSPSQFGYLVLASFTVICIGWFSYAMYSRSRRHHILPFHRYFNCHATEPIPRLEGNKCIQS